MKTALYIHFPFCVRKCLYCDFNSRAGLNVRAEEYVHLLLDEMRLRREKLPGGIGAETLYFGGGTPSLLEPLLVARIIEAAAGLFGLEGSAEITLEANPGTVDAEKLAAFRAAGVNRLSLGVQSFSDRMLHMLGRVHDARQALVAFDAARGAGFADIGIDLIHSLPGQDLKMWLAELERAVRLRPEHISAYGLSVEAGTPFHAMKERGKLALPDEETAALMFESTDEVLGKAGYEHYEISNFALPGHPSRHNGNYWQRGNYLGFGAGAHSFLATPRFGHRWKNVDDPEYYLETVAGGTLPEEETTELAERDAMAETLFLGLRMLEGIDTGLFRRQFGIPLERAYAEELPPLLAGGLLESSNGRLRLTRRGLILANRVFVEFV
ncbi:MAG TPA: radical SAM family heme chaperone HemW [Geobacteraceae bacterium]